MKKLRFMLEYECYPIWIYDEKGEMLQNGLPDGLKNDKRLVSLLGEIHEEFDSLYENTNICFQYNGFATEFAKNEFFEKVNQAIDLIKDNAKNFYAVQVDVEKEDY